jgi:nitric oxide reductase large subunit
MQSGAFVTNLEGVALWLLLIESFLFATLGKTPTNTSKARWMRALTFSVAFISVVLFSVALFKRM